MKNTKLELFNSLTNDNQFIVLFIGKNSQYNDMVQRVYNLHWNSIVTTFNLDENRCGISANQFNELESYRKVFPIGIEDSENRKNLFNKKKLTPISVVSCIEKKQAQYKRTFNKYLDKLHDRLSVGGTLIVDGFTVEEYERLNLAEYISDLGTNVVSFYRCDESLRQCTGLSSVKLCSEGIEEYLSEYLGNIDDTDYFDIEETFLRNEVYYFSNGQSRSFEKKKLIDSSGILQLISTDEIDEKKIPRLWEEQYFYSFIKESKNAPQWYAYENDLTIERTMENDLLKRVRSWLKNPGEINKRTKERKNMILCVSGQSCCGKSVSIAKVAFQIFKEHEFPVVFIDKHADFSYTSEYDKEKQEYYTQNKNLKCLYEVLDQLKEDGANSILLVWDLSAYYNDMAKYIDLAKALTNRNVNFTLLCSSYEFTEKTFRSEFPEVSPMPLAVFLDEDEKSRAIKILRNKANMQKAQVEKIMNVASQGNLLELIYLTFRGAKDSMAAGVKAEALTEALELSERLNGSDDNINQRSYVRIAEEKQIKTAMQEAFEKAGLLVESKSVEKNNVNDLIMLLSFCTKLNKGVPIMLALRSCDLDVSNLELLLNLNVVDFVSNDNGDILIYIRSRIEAEILLKDDEEDTKNIVSLIGKLINQIDSSSSDDVVFLIRDILIDIGPNSKDENLKDQFSDYLGEILEYLEECRENGGDPRIVLQELTITREYYWNLYKKDVIEQYLFKDALRKSISIGEKIADNKTLDKSLKYKIIGEISHQKMLTEDSEDITCEGLFFNLCVSDLKSIMDNMGEAIQYEPDNSYYYVYWIKAALLLLNNQNVSPEEKSEILEKVLFLDEGLNEEHTNVKNTFYLTYSDKIMDKIKSTDDVYLKEQINRGIPAAAYVLAFKEMGEELVKKLSDMEDDDRFSVFEFELLNNVCKDYLVKFADIDKKCCKLLIKIKKCVFNGRCWQNYQHKLFIQKSKFSGITSISKENWNELYRMLKQYFDNYVKGSDYIRDSYNEIYLLALASAQSKLFDKKNPEEIFKEAITVLRIIDNDTNIKERQIEGRMDSRQFLCDEKGRIILFSGHATRKNNKKLPVMIDGKKEAVFANISDLNLKNDTIDEGMQSDFAISFSYRSIKAYRFDSKETIKYSDLRVK